MVDLIDAVAADARVATPTAGEVARHGRRPRTWDPRRWDWRDWRTYAPLVLVAFAVGFSAWMLRAELHAVPYPNDASTHESFARFAAQRIRAGHSPFDAWYPYLGVGTPEFLQYQALSHILTGLTSIVLGDSVFRWANYLLLITWPGTIYVGARLFGFDRWQAGATALISPMMVNVTGYGFEWGSFTWLGSGMWSMLWALWLMPIALGLAWRAVAKGERYGLTAFVLGLTCAFHFITGYLILLSIGVYALLNLRQLLTRVGRAALVGIGSLLIFAFVFVPTLTNLDYVNVNSFQVHTFWTDSYGPGKVFTWLWKGQIFDAGRHPVITILVAIGALVCLVRSFRSETARVPLGLMVLSLLMYSGHRVVGPILDRLPGGSDILLHRMIIGVHFAGMLLAGVGAVWAFGAVAATARFVARVRGRNLIAAMVACALAAVVMWPVLLERKHYGDRDSRFVAGQMLADDANLADFNALLDVVKSRGDGRVYAGLLSNWGGYTKLDQVSLLELPLQHNADSLGFTLRTNSLSQDIEAAFNENNPAEYDLFNVKYALFPAGRQPPADTLVQPTPIAQRGVYTLWEMKTSGYLEVVDATEPLVANRDTMLAVMGPYLNSPSVAQFRHPLVSFNGRSTPAPSLSGNAPFLGPPGTVDSSEVSFVDGRFAGTVTASRDSWVMLKESYYPHWQATVDGKPVKTAMLAPSFVGVPIPAGTHQVVFQYHSESSYPFLFALGALTLAGFAFGPSLWRRYRRQRSESGRGPQENEVVAPEPELETLG